MGRGAESEGESQISGLAEQEEERETDREGNGPFYRVLNPESLSEITNIKLDLSNPGIDAKAVMSHNYRSQQAGSNV